MISSLAAAGTCALLSSSVGAATPDLCVAQALGVPSRYGPPRWDSAWTGDAAAQKLDQSLGDPRWLLSSGQNFQFNDTGGAQAPLETRALYFDDSTGQRYLYLSFVVNITPMSSGFTTAPRDLYLGFRPSAPFDPSVLDSNYHAGAENSYIFQFHLDATVVGDAPSEITRCDSDATCTGNYWRVYADHGGSPYFCADPAAPGGTASGSPYTPVLPVETLPLPDPAGPPAWMNGAVSIWKEGASLQNQWAVQVRIPVVDATPSASHPHPNLRDGVVMGSTPATSSQIWYEVTANVSTERTSIGSWPRASSHVCTDDGNDTLVIPGLSDPTKWSAITPFAFGSTPPAGCAGISIAQGDIGAVFNPTGTPDYTTIPLTSEIKAFLPATTTPAPNEIVARIQNSSAAAIAGNFIAHFRIANWGTAPFAPGWGTTDIGTFENMRGAENGICASGGAGPACTSVSVPAGSSGKIAMHFPFEIGGLGADKSEYCKYLGVGVPLPGGATCVPGCSCTASGAKCDSGDTGAGIWAVDPGTGGTTYSCVSQRVDHQCMLVEIDAVNSNVDFVSRSNWNNMEFRATSTLAQTATIDVRGLPKVPGQLFQDVYLVVMPRNMPATIATPSTSVDLIRSHTDDAIVSLARPYLDDMQGAPQGEVDKIRGQFQRAPLYNPKGSFGGNGYGSGSDGGIRQRKPNDRELQLIQAAAIMPDSDFKRAQGLLDVALTPDGPGQAEILTHRAVDELGPHDASQIIPTLDIYAFYRIDPLNKKGPARYAPMTSFSVFLFHDATPISGINWRIDGFQKVGENIFHQVIPVERMRKIQIRAQSIEAGQAPIPPGNPRWPCAGCCGGPNCGTMAGLNNTLPGFVAGVFIFGRRRKKRAKK